MGILCSHSLVFPIAYVLGSEKNPYIITENITYKLSNGKIYTIEKGLRLDGTSVPKLLRTIEPRINNRIIGSALHDSMYINDFLRGELTDKEARKFIDKEMLLFWNKYNPKHKRKNKAMYYLVRAFGAKVFSNWNKTKP
tara:strand:- start:108 stop:524 length:417 start_codon:yes stop_codon:yes gene_type:complete